MGTPTLKEWGEVRAVEWVSPSNKLDRISIRLYGSEATQGLPADAVHASFGCGNPTASADLHTGAKKRRGSGGGIG